MRVGSGYSNAVYVLNDACKTLYSSTKFNASARNICLEDIEKYVPSAYIDRREEGEYIRTNEYWPAIFPDEKNQSVEGSARGFLEPSEQFSLYTDIPDLSLASTLTLSKNFRSYDCDSWDTDPLMRELIFLTGRTQYHIATRSIRERRHGPGVFWCVLRH